MWKQLAVSLLALFGVVRVCQGTWAASELYPSCIGTGLPNFSFATGSNGAAVGSVPCIGVTQYIPPPLTMTWYYYESYPPAPCDNPDLPEGDQCCHSTVTSTINFTSNTRVNLFLSSFLVLTGNVVAGEFLGSTIVKTIPLNLATLNLNCATAYGQEASVATPTIEFIPGPTCADGAMFVQFCPGSH